MAEIFIDQGEFKGTLTLSGNGKDIPLVPTTIKTKSGTKKIYKAEVDPGTHWLDTGAGIDLSTIVFEVDSAGEIDSVQPTTSAKANTTTLSLTTAEIQISSGNYLGMYRTTLLPADPSNDINASLPINHLLKLHAIVDRTFKIGNTARLGGSAFNVIVRKDERVQIASTSPEKDRISVETSNLDASFASGINISLRTAEVDVVVVNDPISISGYEIVNSTKRVTVIRGLRTRLARSGDLAVDFVPM